MKTEDKLDLHGVRHGDATRKVIRFIEDHWDCGREIEIITGHSKVMRRIVEKTLEEYDLEFTINSFLPYIKIQM
jgi:DNA-nicking Smr family endonuclease